MPTVAPEVRVCQHEAVAEDHLCMDCGSYVMPSILQGATISYYDATLAPARRVIAQVIAVARSRRTITVWIPSSTSIRELVRHISDPKLKDSNDHRENGAWDYSEEYVENKRRFDELQQQIADLSSKFNALSKKQPKE